jgi:UDP-N-acetylglucosamine:LPS N-acetylglucosamine transferase
MKKVLFVASTGGHLFELLELKSIFEKYDYHIVTERTDMTKTLKEAYKNRISYLLFIGNRNYSFIFKFFCNCMLSLYLYIKTRPAYIVTTGSNTAIPLCYIGKFFRSKIIFIETRSDYIPNALTPKIVYPIADLFVIQNKNLFQAYPNAVLCEYNA